jgi:hypothetical protein
MIGRNDLVDVDEATIQDNLTWNFVSQFPELRKILIWQNRMYFCGICDTLLVPNKILREREE